MFRLTERQADGRTEMDRKSDGGETEMERQRERWRDRESNTE